MSLEKVDAIIDQVIPSLEGWCSVPKAKRLARLVVETANAAPRTHAGPLCLELGVFGGRGIITMGLAIKHALNDIGRVVGVDPYCAPAALEGVQDSIHVEWWTKVDYPRILAGVLAAINRLNLRGVTIIASRSQDAVSGYEDSTIDLLHQDSNHSEEVSRKEVELWTPKMRPGGYWVFDDIDWATTKPAQADLLEKGFTLLEDHKTWAIYKAPTHILHAPTG